MKYHIVHLGCQMNMADTERVRTVLNGMGYSEEAVEEEADILGIVACSVRQKAIDRVYSRISLWNKWKNKRNLLTFVTGCMLPRDKEKFLQLFDLTFHINELPELPEMISHYGITTPVSASREFIPLESLDDHTKGFWQIQQSHSSTFEAYIPIQNGCDKFCTYCAVPYTRGREVSRPSEDIIRDVRTLVEQGYKSITLLGQNVNSYGLDKPGEERSFTELLEAIGQLSLESNNKFWLYFTSPHPRDMTDDVIDVMAKYDCLAKQIHLPVQSGDDKVLIKMNRAYNVEHYRGIVSKIRQKLPTATLCTDIIVGFAGETDEAYENTRKVLEEFKYNMAYIAMYSPRPGAASAKWEDDVPHEEKKRRLHDLSAALQKVSAEHYASWIGKEVEVLVSNRDRHQEYLSSKTEGRLIVRFKSDDDSLIGQFVKLKITKSAAMSMEGELIG